MARVQRLSRRQQQKSRHALTVNARLGDKGVCDWQQNALLYQASAGLLEVASVPLCRRKG